MSLPPVTTVQQPITPVTTTAVNPSSSNQAAPPSLRTRPAGWHAKSFGFDWNKRSDQHKYLLKSGLPKVHAAIVNDDWDLALELIGPDDFGLHWMPTTSQLPTQNGSKDLDTSTWAIKLMSRNEDIRNKAVVDMAIQTCDATSIDKNSLYGANLLNLCLLKPARSDVLQYVIMLAAKQAPQYLNLPDALGRTPLWVAIENQDQASIQLLLKSGSDPLQACKFSKQGEPKSLLSLAAKYANKEIFRDLLRATIDQGKKFTPYDFNEDPLYLKRWAADHSSEDVLWLADQLEIVRGPLFCCNDVSGSSYFYRSVIDGSLGRKLKNGNEDLINWLRNLDISPAASNDIESSPLYAAASQSTIHTYLQLSDFFFDIDKDLLCNLDMEDLNYRMKKNFYLTHTVKNYEDYLDSQPEALQELKSQSILHFVEEQLQVLLENHTELNFDEFSRTLKSIWTFISDDNKNEIFTHAALRTDGSREFVLSLLDCELKSSTLEAILELSGLHRNTAAFEFAAERSLEMVQLLESLRVGNRTGRELFHMALAASSLKWVEKLINAGYSLQKDIAISPAIIIRLAEIDPQGLANKLQGLQYTIIPQMIRQANTEAAKQALTALMTKASNHS